MRKNKPLRSPRKQRKLLHNAPAHIRHDLMAAPLSKELFASKHVKSIPVRKGDSVRITRGDHKGFEGKISRVDLKKYRIYLEGLTREKVDGTTIFISVHPSKVMIRSLNLDDKWRKAIFERKAELAKTAKTTAKAAKPTKKAVKKHVAAEETTKAIEEKPVKEKPAVAEEKPAKIIEEKPVKVEEEKPAKAEVPAEAPPEAKPKPKAAKPRAPRKTAAKVEEAKAPVKEVKAEEPAKKEAKPKATKKTPAKATTKAPAKTSTKTPTKTSTRRKTPPKTEGGT
jgi:large subunit ribosomal protein L24